MKPSDAELKPCPFCGGEQLSDHHDDGYSWTACETCGANGPGNTRYSADDEENFVDWNTRTPSAAPASVPAELVEQWRKDAEAVWVKKPYQEGAGVSWTTFERDFLITQAAAYGREQAQQIPAIRTAVADYMRSEGCSCCRDHEAHEQHAATLAKMLDVPMYSDGSGYDFNKFRTGAAK